ncbi:hypothetical protein C7B77_10840 [Chamaesiphon polymorphus CCALA 037]|uniref:Uncharacterized protein n=1 Tax=Chamaesiphon polymorphus CCALA 037 TaxID=2107692 RepID=A0A2T1GGF3_9CYAN|nr:hypothetical protein C7B77_10840 [Chamaesiphon polymorphus CCALA 037]
MFYAFLEFWVWQKSTAEKLELGVVKLGLHKYFQARNLSGGQCPPYNFYQLPTPNSQLLLAVSANWLTLRLCERVSK